MSTDSNPTSRLRPLQTEITTRDYLKGLWARRDFAIAMPAETLRSRHQTTLLGNVWHLANPLLTVGVYYIVFGQVLNANRGIDNYILWLTVGVFAYRLTQSSVLGGATSIGSNMGLMRAIKFPRALLPISVILGGLYTFAFELIVLCIVAVLTGAGLHLQRLAVLPLIVLVQSMLDLGGAFIAARLNDSMRDIQQLIPFAFRLLQFVSGVMYPIGRYLDSDHEWLHRFVVWNPIVHILDMYRWVFLGTPVPLGDIARTVLVSVIALVVGFRFFLGGEHRYGRP